MARLPKADRDAITVKECEHCGEQFSRKPVIAYDKFKSQRFCSVSCHRRSTGKDAVLVQSKNNNIKALEFFAGKYRKRPLKALADKYCKPRERIIVRIIGEFDIDESKHETEGVRYSVTSR